MSRAVRFVGCMLLLGIVPSLRIGSVVFALILVVVVVVVVAVEISFVQRFTSNPIPNFGQQTLGSTRTTAGGVGCDG